MPRSATNAKTSARLASSKISDCGLSRRQKQLLEGLFALFSSEMAPRLGQMLIDLEQQMNAAAAQSGSEDAQRLLEAQRQIQARRNELSPRFLARVEAALARAAEPQLNAPLTPPVSLPFSELSLVDTGDLDEAVALKEIAARIEQRSTLPLFLLGQRLGAVVGGPAFDTQTLPLGPHRLCQALGEAAEIFELDAARRTLLYRQFDLSVLRFAGPLFEALNHYLIGEGVFPNLTFVPPRRQASQQGREQARRQPLPEPAPQTGPDTGHAMPHGGHAADALHAPPPGTARATPWLSAHAPPPGRIAAMPTAPHPAASTAAMRRNAMPSSPAPGLPTPPLPARSAPQPTRQPPGASPAPRPAATALPIRDASDGMPDTLPWNASGQPDEAMPPNVESFDILRRLLAGRRNLIDRLKPGSHVNTAPLATAEQVQRGLDRLQHQISQPPGQAPSAAFADIRRQLLEQMRHSTPDGRPPRLSPEQGDTLSLVGMLFDQIGQEVRPNSPGGQLLAQLQVPLLRVAMQDESFFIDRNNPARQLLNAIAEAGAYWSSEDETDTELMQKMSTLVRRITTEYDGENPALFDDLMKDLTAHLTAQQHKAEISERRHVEAARGREKLEIARLQAEEAINSLLEGKPVPRFLRSLLEQVWTDVMALALLRGGESSPAFQQHMTLTRRLIAATVQCSQTGKRALAVSEAEAMQKNIAEALLRIGQNQEDATEIARRMLLSATTESANAPAEAEAADAASRNELVMKLQGRNRLGQDVQDTVSARARIKAERIASLTPAEKQWHDQLQQLPFGTWFEFTLGNDTRVRRRMSWYSTVTDHCLFVNHRGQRIGEYTLCWLARELTRGSVKPIEPSRESIVDRAWNAIVKALRSFVGQPSSLQTSAVPG